ncbi:HIT-like protein [Stipitochalara longipes BDJ]|nr:HIT-like protein [Stipitochalara longipes BDJ]
MAEEAYQDAITEEEIAGTAPTASSASPSRNAFTALMSQKRKASPSSSPSASKRSLSSHAKNVFKNRDGLGAYTSDPAKHPPSRVIYYDVDFVAIHDMYPKSSVHTLLLPRDEKYAAMHPFDAFEDAEFLAQVREQAAKLKDIVASELQRKYGRFSEQEKPRQAVLNGEVEIEREEDMPAGRDWEKEVLVGIHAHPSMNHLHVHILSKDRYSECLKHRKHYNSFATRFFVPLEDFPLGEDDVRRHPGKEGYLKSDLKCWRCGKNFGNKFAQLKEHLKEEFEAWKKE